MRNERFTGFQKKPTGLIIRQSGKRGGVSDTEIMKEKGVYDFKKAKAYSYTAFLW